MDMFEQSGHAERLKAAIRDCDSVIVGAGAGLSTAAGLTYTGERFERYFGDFAAKYGFRDMYSGGFYPYPAPEEHWAYWSRCIWINRYAPIPKDTYAKLLELVEDRDHFVITTNVDHCFQRAGFATPKAITGSSSARFRAGRRRGTTMTRCWPWSNPRVSWSRMMACFPFPMASRRS